MDKGTYVTRYLSSNFPLTQGEIYREKDIFPASRKTPHEEFPVEATFVEQPNKTLMLFWIKSPETEKVRLRKEAEYARKRILDIEQSMQNNPYFKSST
jgi:hypothetical protein